MKINVTVDLSEMYTNEEGEDSITFSDAIKNTIKYDVTQAVLNDWRKSIGNEFNREVVDSVQSLRNGFMEATLQGLLAEPKVKKSFYGEQMVSLGEYIKECIAADFEKRGIDEKIQKVVRDLADTMSKGLVSRYDTAFATRIVEKLHENKMLKSDVASLLLAAPESASA